MPFEHFPQQENSPRRIPHPRVERAYERSPREERFVSLSDIHNDIFALRASLMQKKLIGKHGNWKRGLESVSLVITGDSINKKNPNPEVLRYLHHLHETVPEGCTMSILVGNHELNILMREAEGIDTGLGEEHIEFFGNMQVVNKQGPILFLHRYPSLAQLQELEAQYCECGGVVPNEEWHINTRFRDAFATRKENPSASRAVFQACDDGGENSALEGLPAKEYYEKYGEAVRDILTRMGITVVIHGHKRQASGGQQFEEYIPGILMIDNDTGVSSDKNKANLHGLASTEVSLGERGAEITCVYTEDIMRHSGKPRIQSRVLPPTLH